MLTKNGQVKLIDFGTAWVRGQDKNRVQGTPNYIAPEQATEKVVDEKTDIYNLAHDVPHVHRPVCPAGHPQAGRRPEAGSSVKSTRAFPARSTS